MNRRDVLAGGGAVAALIPAVRLLAAASPLLAGAARAQEGLPFTHASLIEAARQLAENDHKPAEDRLSDEVANLTYDQYRDIRYKSDRSIWAGEGLGFTVDLFHPGSFFKIPVDISIVEGGTAHRIAFSPDLFDYGPTVPKFDAGKVDGFAGFRVRRPINSADVWDEFLVFQGASYFRAVAPGQQYGLSARGLAVKTGDAEGEEFPAFTRFFIEKPEPDAGVLVIHALLESASVTGAFRFTVRPESEIVMDVEAALFARVAIDKVGLAPLTSMFMFDSTNRSRFDDFREAVHDSDGLLIVNGAGERLWRPLANPELLQISSFLDRRPQGFGLIQRRHRFSDFEDLEARYDLRPSLWVEPVGDWGEGAVVLVEIPTSREIHDNIVAFWRPSQPFAPGQQNNVTYRLRWGEGPGHQRVARVLATRVGLNFEMDRRLFVVDFEALPEGAEAEIDLSASAGEIRNANLQPNHVQGGLRASFEVDPKGAELIEFRLRLVGGGKALSETWMYRWTA